jgi:ATP-dependent Clp protease ATP-binding subunit ClpA
MKVIPLIALALFMLTACAQKSEVDEANKKIAELQAQTAKVQAEAEKLKAQAAIAQAEAEKSKVEAEAAKKENQDLEVQNSQLQAKVDEKPPIPVSVSFRPSLMGKGIVAVFNTTIKAPVAAKIQVHSASLGTTKQFELHLESSHSKELGHLEGAFLENGDTITIENNNYSSSTVIVSN